MDSKREKIHLRDAIQQIGRRRINENWLGSEFITTSRLNVDAIGVLTGVNMPLFSNSTLPRPLAVGSNNSRAIASENAISKSHKAQTIKTGDSTPFSAVVSAALEPQKDKMTASLSHLSANGTRYTDAQVKDFFAANPSSEKIARQAASMGLTESQILDAMQTGGFGETDPTKLKHSVEDFVADPKNCCAWATDGTLKYNSTISRVTKATVTAASAPTSEYHFAQEAMAKNAANAKGTDMVATAFGFGQSVSVKSLREFFSTNPSDNEVLKQAATYGMTLEELTGAMVYGRGDTYNSQPVNDLINSSSEFGYNSGGQVIALNGRSKSDLASNSMLEVYDPHNPQGPVRT